MGTVVSVNLDVIVILIVGELNAEGMQIIAVGGKLESAQQIRKDPPSIHGTKLA